MRIVLRCKLPACIFLRIHPIIIFMLPRTRGPAARGEVRNPLPGGTRRAANGERRMNLSTCAVELSYIYYILYILYILYIFYIFYILYIIYILYICIMYAIVDMYEDYVKFHGTLTSDIFLYYQMVSVLFYFIHTKLLI